MARLQPPLTVPQNVSSLTIGADGTVSAFFGGGAQQLGNFQITRFLNSLGLSPWGEISSKPLLAGLLRC